MSKRITHVSNLPAWFNFEKYKATNLLDSAGWYEQLSVREGMRSLLSERKTDQVEQRKWKSEILALLRDEPIVNITSNDLLMAVFYGGALCELKPNNSNPCYSLGVHLTTVRNLYLAELNIAQEKRAYARDFFAEYLSDDWFDKPYTPKCQDWIDEPVDFILENPSRNVNIKVNLRLPDKVLLEQFKRLLGELRGHLEASGEPAEHWRKPDYANWISFGVLPYLDLKMWEKETGCKIPNRVMADAIFLSGEGGEEVVRKTTSKLAEELLTTKHLETLAALAAHEIAERNTS